MDGDDDVEAWRRRIDHRRGRCRGDDDGRRRVIDAGRRIAALIRVMLAPFAALMFAPLMLPPFVSAPKAGPSKLAKALTATRRIASARHVRNWDISPRLR